MSSAPGRSRRVAVVLDQEQKVAAVWSAGDMNAALGRDGSAAAAELERATQTSGIADTAKLRELRVDAVALAATPAGAR